MINLLKEVGRGKRGARDLTYEEARRAAELIVTGGATPAQIGAFLVAERIKMESLDELRAFIDALRERAQLHRMAGGFDCAGPYDGRTRSFMATLPTAFVLAANGLPATLHGSAALPPKWGVTLPDVLRELGAAVEAAAADTLAAAADVSGFLYVPSEAWCPPLAELRGIREELGLRTVFNTAEKLLRYSDAPYMAAGVFHGTVFEKVAKLVMDLGVERGIIVQGMEGSEDLGVDKRTRTYLIHGGASELFIVDPELYELQVEVPDAEWTAARQAEMTLSVLRGQAELPYWNMVLLNSAVRLWIGEKVGSIEEGIYRARAALDEGKALAAFDRWKAALAGAAV
ncbi:anthranilate phosphoribosyltransferase [Gordoniibacillus kamchatkensis]|uniref:Anthranilate phosphoribosyltransferase n=1 Tax=Gordoniibacillus kamchatkensis TaxID=1590651 RepID=A0ABR5ACL6_9BACL|nr:anthranilate phosphoribosyltransferase [Paenibacillus sp. VKM B-2647]KIL38764.1 anthranilate phosphoribosyltransferase [Paenibacillus sp. VKM B-2647]